MLKAQQACELRHGVLPYGDTLHGPDCGCPENWSSKSIRAADLADASFHQAFRRFQQGSLTPCRHLTIAYMLPHHNVTGGMKCLVEHIKLLVSRGHKVIAAHRSDTADTAMPPWTTVQASVDVVCRLHQRLGDVYPASEIDVVVVGIFHQVAELLVGIAAPVLYWEQGHEWLFGDPVRFQVQHNYKKQDQLFHMVMHLPVALAAVSGAVQSILSQEFGRASTLIPNCVDCERFRPGPLSSHPYTAVLTAPVCQQGSQPKPGVRSVLLVGNPALQLKGFDVAIAVLAAVNQVLPLHITWVCQNQPTAALLPALLASGLRIHLHVDPPQEVLPELYCGHDAFLFSSRYEAWGMPVLEAMAAGLAVVATACLGVDTFARHGMNALLAPPQDVMGLVRNLYLVLTDEQVRLQLQLNARQTAEQFTPVAIAERWLMTTPDIKGHATAMHVL
ncbi:hypothetical protein ABBQ32_000515 [Trebouxia sp. C0010 RCD-2024]